MNKDGGQYEAGILVQMPELWVSQDAEIL